MKDKQIEETKQYMKLMIEIIVSLVLLKLKQNSKNGKKREYKVCWSSWQNLTLNIIII